jgi:membrane-bound lytic murein transglycosylase F
MNKRIWITLLAGAVVLVIALFFIFRIKETVSVLEYIKKAGEITVLTRNNAHCYYNYQDKSMGFEYTLAKAFADYLGVELKVKTPVWQDIFRDLLEGEGDFIAASLTITPKRMEIVDFSDPYFNVQQHVIVHKSNHNLDKIEDLNGKTIYVRRATSYEERLRELKNSGLDVKIRLYDEVPTEEFIRMVAEKEIHLTVADSNIARLNQRYYPEIRMAFPIEEPQPLAWAVRKGENSLRTAMNEFFMHIMKTGKFAKIHDQYYGHVEFFDYFDVRKYHMRLKTRLPLYKQVIKKAAEKHGFDWRLIAALIYQESHFDPEARSYTGVEGIMQLTQVTSEELGVDDRLNVKEAINGGVRYLKLLYNRFDKAGEPDRTLITLASYNVGYEHVVDAQEIASDFGMNPNSWSALEQVLPLLRYPKYYQKTEHGYCRGTEPVRYVRHIRTYYDILKRSAIKPVNDDL